MFFLYQFCGATFFFEITNYPGKNNNFWWARGCLFSISAATRKGQHKKFQRAVMRYVWAGVFHSAFSRVNRLPGERRASKSAFPADRQCYYRRREAIKKRIKSSIWSDFSVCGVERETHWLHICTSGGGKQAREREWRVLGDCRRSNSRPEGVWKSTHLFSYTLTLAVCTLLQLQFIRDLLWFLVFCSFANKYAARSNKRWIL